MNKPWLAAVSGVLVSAAVLLAGCEGITTGREIAALPLPPAADGTRGAYAPLKFTLSPEMNPVAFNLRADFTRDPAEFGKWNSYRATLKRGGMTLASRDFNVNHPASGPDSPPPAATVHTLLYVDVDAAGDYELMITPTQPVAVTLTDARVDARRNVQRPVR